MTPILPGIAAVLFILIAMYLMKRDTALGKRSWFYPALLSAAFLIFSLITVITEGPLGYCVANKATAIASQEVRCSRCR